MNQGRGGISGGREVIEGAVIEVINWDKYNPRGDSKRPIWFRLENTIATGPAFFDFDCEQKWLWVFILSLVSQKNGEPIVWSTSFCQSLTKIKPSKQEETIDLYEKFARLRVSREVTLRDPAQVAHYERTNITNEHNEHNEHAHFDFEVVYENYPRKIGKSEGIKKCKKEILAEEDYQALRIAVKNYAAYLIAQKTDPKYIKHFSTFMTSWRDWLDPGAGTSLAGFSPKAVSSLSDRNEAALAEYIRRKEGV